MDVYRQGQLKSFGVWLFVCSPVCICGDMCRPGELDRANDGSRQIEMRHDVNRQIEMYHDRDFAKWGAVMFCSQFQ